MSSGDQPTAPATDGAKDDVQMKESTQPLPSSTSKLNTSTTAPTTTTTTTVNGNGTSATAITTPAAVPAPTVAAGDDSDDDLPLSALKKKTTEPKAEPAGSPVKRPREAEPKSEPANDDDDSDDIPLAQMAKKKKKEKKEGGGSVKSEKKKRAGDDADSDDVPLAKLKKTAASGDKGDAAKKEKKEKKVKKEKKEKKVKKEKGVKKEKKKTTPKKEKEAGKGKGKGKAKKKKDEGPPVREWWKEQRDPDDPNKWDTLEHNGVLFPPEYTPHGTHILYDGKTMQLSPAAEEVATMYAVMIDTDWVKNPAFKKNFFACWRKKMTKEEKGLIKSLDKCDFSKIHKMNEELKEKKKAIPKEEKKKMAEAKKKVEEPFLYALVDGHKEKVGNFRVEPPGLFRGRGQHPLAGTLKARIRPEDITLNLGQDAKVPDPPPGHKWGDIVHKKDATWLAMWRDSVKGDTKYVWLSANSAFRGQADYQKFEKARKLKKYIDKIRKSYTKDLKSKDLLTRQMATAMWVIDHLALRAGNEKDDDEADTVGCCSLRVEHITLTEPNKVTLDFLGKDSIRYLNTVDVDEQVFKNFGIFMKKKKPDQDLFDQLTVSTLNQHLKNFMPGLSAKVFRTFNASITLEKELRKFEDPKNKMTIPEKVLFYNKANREVAILCNHQRSVPKAHGAQMDKLKDKLKATKHEKNIVLRAIKHKKGKDLKEKAKAQKKEDKELFEKLCGWNVERLQKKLATLKDRITKQQVAVEMKDDNKTVALGTSKLNYLDPRTTVAWCKRVDLPVEKVFNKSLLEKFPWAKDVAADWEF